MPLRSCMMLRCETYQELVDAETAGLAQHDAIVFVKEATRFAKYAWDDDGVIWKRVAGKFTSIDSASPLDMSSGVLTMDEAIFATAAQGATADDTQILATETAATLLATQASLDELTNQYNLLLKWVVTTFGQVPEGLDSQLEAAMEAS